MVKSTLISNNDLINYHSNGLKIGDYTDASKLLIDVKTMIERVIEIHYGIRAGLLSEALIESTIKEIVKRFKTLTVRDIDHAYERAIITKNDWRNVTKKEVIEPIQNWWNKKEAIRVEFEKHKIEEIELNQAIEAEAIFKNESKKLYNECLKSGEWIGSVFQASSIGKDIAQHIDQSIKSDLWKTANEMHGKLINIEEIGVSTLKIYSKLIVEYGVFEKIECFD